MTDQPKYWITEQGMKEAAKQIADSQCMGEERGLELREHIIARFIAEHSEAAGKDWKREALALVVLLRAKCSDEEWVTMQSRFEAAAHSEAASPPNAEQFLESLPARETFPINRTETAELLAKFADWLLRRPVPTFTMCSADIGKVSPVIVEAAAPPQGTPAPEPGMCEKCGKPKLNLGVTLCTAMLRDPRYAESFCFCTTVLPGHSTVAAQKGE